MTDKLSFFEIDHRNTSLLKKTTKEVQRSLDNLLIRKELDNLESFLSEESEMKDFIDALLNFHSSTNAQYDKGLFIEETYDSRYDESKLVIFGKRMETDEEKEYRLKYFNDLDDLEKEVNEMISNIHGSKMNIWDLGTTQYIVDFKRKTTSWLRPYFNTNFELHFENDEVWFSLERKLQELYRKARESSFFYYNDIKSNF